MRRFSLVALALGLFFLAGFVAANALDVSYLAGTEWVEAHARPSAAILVNALLVADVLLPIPSSLLMIANGTLLGPLPGAAASLASSTLSALLAFWLGRRSAPWLMRRISPEERVRAERHFDRWGWAAVIMSRPIPLLAETVGVLAGTTRLSWTRFGAAVLLGNVPPAVLYAFAGAMAWRTTLGVLILVILLGITALVWVVSRRVGFTPR